MKSLIFDTETTGLPKPSCADLKDQPKIIEIGLILTDGPEIIGEYGQLVHPGEEITEEITKITGITNEDLEGRPSFKDVLPQLSEMFSQADELIAHNAGFDTSLLNFELRRNDVTDFPMPNSIVCTVEEYEALFGYKIKLLDLHEKILGVPLAQTHRALDDARALYEILKGDKWWG